MPLPKQYYADARTKKRLRELEQRVDQLDKDLELAENTIILLHENLHALMTAYREGSFFIRGQKK